MRSTDRWRVDGPRLCVLNHAFSQDEQCYTVAVAPDGAVQFFIDRPGGEYHGLLTSVVRNVQDGPPQPGPSGGWLRDGPRHSPAPLTHPHRAG